MSICARRSQPTCVGRNGGYADAIRVNARFAIPVPEALESENVAPLLCGGITVYTPLRNHGVRPSSRVGVVGIGGLGHLGLQFAKAFGAEVTALSTSKDKEAEALELGAHHFVNTRDTGALKKIAGAFDLLLSTVSADQDWQALVNSLRPKGTLCVVGVPPSPIVDAGVSADRRAEGGFGEPIGESAGPARDAGCGGAAWGEGGDGAVCDGEGERRDCEGEEEQGAVSGGAGELRFVRMDGGEGCGSRLCCFREGRPTAEILGRLAAVRGGAMMRLGTDGCSGACSGWGVGDGAGAGADGADGIGGGPGAVRGHQRSGAVELGGTWSR